MISLHRTYAGYPAGSVIELDATTEAALVAQGYAAVSTAAPSVPGAQSTSARRGSVTIATGAANATVVNSNCVADSRVLAYVSQVAADATLLRVERVVTGTGTFTVYGTAAAGADTVIDWILL